MPRVRFFGLTRLVKNYPTNEIGAFAHVVWSCWSYSKTQLGGAQTQNSLAYIRNDGQDIRQVASTLPASASFLIQQNNNFFIAGASGAWNIHVFFLWFWQARNLTYISLLIIFCIIVYVTNKILNQAWKIKQRLFDYCPALLEMSDFNFKSAVNFSNIFLIQSLCPVGRLALIFCRPFSLSNLWVIFINLFKIRFTMEMVL